jgi:hypothetical protein
LPAPVLVHHRVFARARPSFVAHFHYPSTAFVPNMFSQPKESIRLFVGLCVNGPWPEHPQRSPAISLLLILCRRVLILASPRWSTSRRKGRIGPTR